MTEIKNLHKHEYVPNKLRAHPFYFYQLPIYVIFLTIMYWIVLCPLGYWILFTNLEYTLAWAVPYFIISLTIYLVILGILICIWRCKRQRNYEEEEKCRNREYSFYLGKCNKIHEERHFVPLRPQSSKKTPTCCCNQNSCDYCSKIKRSFPMQITISDETPDAIHSADTPQTATSFEECEYFIANVSSPKVCTTEMFLFVEDSKPQDKSVEVIVPKEVLED